MNGSSDRYIRWAIIGVVVLAASFVVLDVGGPLRSVVTALAVFVAPGLAASLSIEAMPVDLRIVVAMILSVAIVVGVTTAATLAASKSGNVVFGIVGLVTIALLFVPDSKRTDEELGSAVDQK